MNTTNDQFLSIISSEAKVLKPLWNLQPTNGNNNSHRQNHRQPSSLRSVSSGRGYNGKKSYLNSSDQIANANNGDYPKQQEDVLTYNYDEWTTPSEETVPKLNGSVKQTNSYNTNANNSNSFNDFHEIANDNGQASNNATKFEYFYYQSTDNQSPTTNVNNNDCCYNLNNSGSTHSKDDFKSTTSPSKFDYNYYQNKSGNSKDDVSSANNHSAYGGNNFDSYSQRSSPDRFSSRSRGRGGRGRGRGGAAGNGGGGFRNNDDFGSSSDRNIPTNDDFLCLISNEAKDYLKKPKVADAVAHARSVNVIDSNSSHNSNNNNSNKNNNQNGFDTNWTGLSSQNKPFRKVSDTLSMNSSMSSKSFRGHGGGGNGGRTRSKIQDFDPILAEYTKSDNITVHHKMVIVNGEDLGHKTFCILQSGILMQKMAMVVHNVAKIADDFASEIQALGIWAFPFNGTTRNNTNLSHCRIPVTLMTYLATHPDVIPFPDIVVNFDSHVRHVEFLERYLNYRASNSGLAEKKTVQVYHLIEERSNFFPIFKGFIARKQKEIGKK